MLIGRSKGTWRTESAGRALPAVGPFTNLSGGFAGDLGQYIDNQVTQLEIAGGDVKPLRFGRYSLVGLNPLSDVVYLWCDVLRISSALSVSGQDGTDLFDGSAGGDGFSGGGAGGAAGQLANGGGQGENGEGTDLTPKGLGNYTNFYIPAYGEIQSDFSLPVSGSGGNGAQGDFWFNGSGGTSGTASNRGGGGGGGGGGSGGGSGEFTGGGGGGGAGIIVVVCNEVIAPPGGAFLLAIGGSGGGGLFGAGGGGGGGGGSIYIATKRYSGNLSAIVDGGLGGDGFGDSGAAGAAEIHEITASNNLIARTFLDSWDNL